MIYDEDSDSSILFYDNSSGRYANDGLMATSNSPGPSSLPSPTSTASSNSPGYDGVSSPASTTPSNSPGSESIPSPASIASHNSPTKHYQNIRTILETALTLNS
ncbi:uncharacterized protein TrAFT101_011697 [Trichoderma asperellum]|uniref:uncharacterized protein n=1 Tax=Trichoderma asperellum TaxID=101201 RepID=UPI0033347D13|nr:hypothetical protein TrAFT101_011697 [Trichoderma asperellum]